MNEAIASHFQVLTDFRNFSSLFEKNLSALNHLYVKKADSLFLFEIIHFGLVNQGHLLGEGIFINQKREGWFYFEEWSGYFVFFKNNLENGPAFYRDIDSKEILFGCEFLNGKQKGYRVEFHEGVITYETCPLGDELSLKISYDEGIILEKFYRVNKVLHGYSKKFFKNGLVSQERYYEKGILNSFINYLENGEISEIGFQS